MSRLPSPSATRATTCSSRGSEEAATDGVEHAQRRYFRDQIHEVVELFGVGPDLPTGDAEQTLAEQAEVGVGDGEDASHAGAECADDEFAIAGVYQQNFRNLRMGEMKAAQGRQGFGNAGGCVHRKNRDPRRCFRLTAWKNRKVSVHLAGGDMEFGMAAQSVGQQLGLHTIGVGDEHTNRIGSGGG